MNGIKVVDWIYKVAHSEMEIFFTEKCKKLLW